MLIGELLWGNWIENLLPQGKILRNDMLTNFMHLRSEYFLGLIPDNVNGWKGIPIEDLTHQIKSFPNIVL